MGGEPGRWEERYCRKRVKQCASFHGSDSSRGCTSWAGRPGRFGRFVPSGRRGGVGGGGEPRGTRKGKKNPQIPFGFFLIILARHADLPVPLVRVLLRGPLWGETF